MGKKLAPRRKPDARFLTTLNCWCVEGYMASVPVYKPACEEYDIPFATFSLCYTNKLWQPEKGKYRYESNYMQIHVRERMAEFVKEHCSIFTPVCLTGEMRTKLRPDGCKYTLCIANKLEVNFNLIHHKFHEDQSEESLDSFFDDELDKAMEDDNE